MTICVVDSGSGNLRSAQRGLEKAGARVQVTKDPQDVARADKIVLPGQGAFCDGMNGLVSRGLLEPLREAIGRGVPMLGICVGLQVLFERGFEDGEHCGMGVLPGEVVRLPDTGPGGARLKIPHMGWNSVRRPVRESGTADCPLLAGIPDESYVYFVHSYHPAPTDPRTVALECEYGVRFCAMAWKGLVFGTQFHPEKSQAVGLRLLANFVNL